MARIEVPDAVMPALCAAVSADTGIPEGRVRKVIQAAQRLQHTLDQSTATHPLASQPMPEPGSPADRLRYYPIGANGRLSPSPGPDPTGTPGAWHG